MPQDIVTLEQVKIHLGLEGSTGHDKKLEMKLEEATVLCLDWVRQRVGSTEARDEWYAIVDAWTDETAPLQIRAAILRMVGHLVRFRGDDDKATALTFENGDLPADVTMFLKRLRDPAFA
jgi:hypothetical protein